MLRRRSAGDTREEEEPKRAKKQNEKKKHTQSIHVLIACLEQFMSSFPILFYFLLAFGRRRRLPFLFKRCYFVSIFINFPIRRGYVSIFLAPQLDLKCFDEKSLGTNILKELITPSFSRAQPESIFLFVYLICSSISRSARTETISRVLPMNCRGMMNRNQSPGGGAQIAN